MQYQPRIQNFWIYTLTMMVVMCAIPYLTQMCLPKKYGTYMFMGGYLVLLYVVISSFVWNNNPEWRGKKVESRSQTIVKNAMDALLLVFILVILYCKFREMRSK